MAFKPTTWYPIAVVLSVVNLVGAGFALGQAQPEHRRHESYVDVLS